MIDLSTLTGEGLLKSEQFWSCFSYFNLSQYFISKHMFTILCIIISSNHSL